MRIIYIISLFTVLLSFTKRNDSKKSLFKFNGIIVGVESGKIEIIKLAADPYYDIELKNYTTNIVNGNFSFSGKINYPQPFYAKITYANQTKGFGYFFLEKGVQLMKIKIDSLPDNFTIIEGSTANQKYISEFRRLYEKSELIYNDWMEIAQKNYKQYGRNTPDSERIKVNELSNLYRKEFNNSIRVFVKNNPSSYVSLWCVIADFSNKGYSTFIDSTELLFSSKIRLTRLGKLLRESLNESSKTSIGMKFPVLNFLDIKNNITTIPINTKYTLIDFWFSSCTPCLAEFPRLQTIYNKYKENKFEIIGISIDSKNKRNSWLQAIDKNQLLWPQFWDPQGDIAIKQLYINSYPSNFLLDSDGKIIKKNINTIDLDRFLESVK